MGTSSIRRGAALPRWGFSTMNECSRRRGRIPGLAIGAMTAATMVACGMMAGCQPGGSGSGSAAPKADAHAAKGDAPSKVTGGVKESELAKLVLTDSAIKRLGVATEKAERKPVPRALSYGGEVMIPPGRLLTVSSPFLGVVEGPPNAKIPQPGATVEQGQPIFMVRPILSPEARATLAPLLKEADGQVKSAQEQLKIQKIAMQRAEELVKQKLMPQASLVDAKANLDVAETALHAAEARRDEILKIAGDPNAGAGMTTLTFRAPVKGILQNVHAQVGQPVPSGALLFAVAELDPIWVRVPVYVGDLDRLAPGETAGVGTLADPPTVNMNVKTTGQGESLAKGQDPALRGLLSAPPGANVRPARPVTAPPSGDPLAATVNLFYEVDNKNHAFRPGQRVGVALPLKGDEDSLAVPRSALIRDALGGTWVYEEIAANTFTRRRVSVDRVVGDVAALVGGLKPDAKVVSVAAAELYGAEFGGQK